MEDGRLANTRGSDDMVLLVTAAMGERERGREGVGLGKILIKEI